MLADICEVKKCRRSVEGSRGIIYSASKSGRHREVCNFCWILHCLGIINLKLNRYFKRYSRRN